MLSPTRPGTRLVMVIATLAWIGFIFVISTLPRVPQPPNVSQNLVSHAGHYVTYLVLTLLVYLLVAGTGRPGLMMHLVGLVLGSAFSIGLGVGIEALQHVLPDRAAELTDVAANALGVATAALGIVVMRAIGIGHRVLLPLAVGLVVSLLAVAAMGAYIWNPSLPRVGDHWHAPYQIFICGSLLPPLPGTPGSIHTHGRGLIHVHPVRGSDAGLNANLGRFFDTTGGELTDSRLTLPNGETYANGDPCPGGETGELQVLVNDTRVNSPAAYVPRAGDRIIIRFGPEGAD